MEFMPQGHGKLIFDIRVAFSASTGRGPIKKAVRKCNIHIEVCGSEVRLFRQWGVIVSLEILDDIWQNSNRGGNLNGHQPVATPRFIAAHRSVA